MPPHPDPRQIYVPAPWTCHSYLIFLKFTKVSDYRKARQSEITKCDWNILVGGPD